MPGTLEATSTDYDRTKMSLALVLAGLYPPTGKLRWNEGLNWQPVPYTSLPLSSHVSKKYGVPEGFNSVLLLFVT